MEVNDNIDPGVDTGEQQAENFEAEARKMGWAPQEEFRGDAAKWVDAQTYVERGRTFLPLLRSNNAKLEALVHRQATELDTLRQQHTATQESIQELQEFHRENLTRAVTEAKQRVLSQIRAAKENGDVDAEMALMDQLTDINSAQRDLKKPVTPATPAPATPPVDPAFAAWRTDNPWFGTDQRKTMLANGIAQQLRADPANDILQGAEFYATISNMMDERTRTTPAADKVAGGGRHSASPMSGGSGRGSFSDLPADAKAACDQRITKMVGEGRAFKDTKSWREYYAKVYFQEEQQ